MAQSTGYTEHWQPMAILSLYQPMTRICIMSSHKPIRIYMGVNTLYGLFCFFKKFLIVGKGLIQGWGSFCMGVEISRALPAIAAYYVRVA